MAKRFYTIYSIKGDSDMKNFFKALLNIFVKPKLDKRKQALREKLQKEIAKTDSEWVKSRNTAYLSILDKADGKALDEIEKAIDKI